MKKMIALILVCCLLLAGCGNVKEIIGAIAAPADNIVTEATTVATAAPETAAPETREAAESANVINPLPDTTMDNLTDAILAVSLEEGGAYVDDEGKMQMDLKIYSYDKYDMVDIAMLKVGDTIVRHDGDVVVTSMEQDETGRIFINGGLDEGGFELVTEEDGVFYEMGYSDTKSWYQVGEATIRVSADFEGVDSADLELGEVVLYPGDFLVGAVINYDFTPYNTTIRVEGGQVMELNRRYIP